MRYPPRLLSLSTPGAESMARHEGFRAHWYLDGYSPRWTIGYGTTESTLPGINRATVPGPITRDRAAEWLREAVDRRYGEAVRRLAHVPLAQAEFDALCSLVYNIGEGAFEDSTVLRELNRGNRQRAANAFLLFNKAGRPLRFSQGLHNRRVAERDLFLSAPPVDVPRVALRPLARYTNVVDDPRRRA